MARPHPISRRRFIQAGMATLTTGALLGGCAIPGPRARLRPDFISAVDLGDHRHAIGGANALGHAGFNLPVGERCHGGCNRPGSHQAVVFARRPGQHAYVLDTRAWRLQQAIAAGPGYHFYGHGVFSHDERLLYATLNEYDTGQGLIRVYDADQQYRAVRDLSVDGIGPHELRLLPDGDHLLIALGGIRTHPDYGRIKLNLDTMQPAVLMMNRHTGAIIRRWQPSDSRLSCRHLDISDDGVALIGYQYQGPARNNPPLIARLDTRDGQFRELHLEPATQHQLRHYTASVVISPTRPHAIVASPWGGRALLLDYRRGQLLRAFQIDDVSGALAEADGGFLLSTGLGCLYRVRADRPEPILLDRQAVHWDHHLIGV
ncbi:MAG: DUF1513 domain-containing protein [Marinobacter sp.]|nr:DUF1513 domain-containing protein [Marinobacter sp.]